MDQARGELREALKALGDLARGTHLVSPGSSPRMFVQRTVTARVAEDAHVQSQLATFDRCESPRARRWPSGLTVGEWSISGVGWLVTRQHRDA
jgi:hypothetical protein